MNTIIRTKNEEGLYFDILDIGKSIEVEKIIEYTRQIGIEAYKSRLKKQDETLLDYVNSFQ